VSDDYSKAKQLMSKGQGIITNLKGLASKVQSLESAPSPSYNANDYQAQAAMQQKNQQLEQARSALTSAASSLNEVLSKLDGFARNLEELSSQFAHNASVYNQAKNSEDIRAIKGVQNNVAQAQSEAARHAEKRSRQAAEIRQFIGQAQNALSSAGSATTSGVRTNSGSIDSIIGSAFNGMGSRQDYKVNFNAYGNGWSKINPSVSGYFNNYRPGRYSLSYTTYSSWKGYDSGGMPWKS